MSSRLELQQLLEALPAGTGTALLALAVPLLLSLLYRRYVRVPSSERAVPFVWAIPPEATYVDPVLSQLS